MLGTMETATPVSLLTEAQWLGLRKASLGSSECAAALGLSPYDTPIDIWMRKVDKAPPIVENEAMRWGKLLEPVLQAEYERREGVTLETQLFVRHPELHYMSATLDGMRPDGRLVEFKTAGAYASGWGDEDTDDVPIQYVAQVTHQMIVSGATEADLAVLVGGQSFRVYRMTLDPELAGKILAGAARFWGCVQRKTPPDWGRLDAKALAVLHPGCEGTIELDADIAAAVVLYEDYGQQINFAETQREACKLQILTAFGGAQDGFLPDGRKVRRYLQDVAERTQTVAAHQRHYFRVLKGAK